MNTATISHQIINFADRTRAPFRVADLYLQIEALRHTIRARVHEAKKAGLIHAIGGGLYIRPGVQLGAIADARSAIRELVAAGAKFDFVVLDVPYHIRSGNRDVTPFAAVTPLEFAGIVQDAEQLLRDDNSPILFIFSMGKTVAGMRTAYQAGMDQSLQLAAFGKYTKTYQNGDPVQFMGREMPREGLFAYTRSGKLDHALPLDLSAVRPPGGTYKTRKPVELMLPILSQALPGGGMVLDPFGGSGSTAEACEELGLSSLSFDIAHDPVKYWQRTL